MAMQTLFNMIYIMNRMMVSPQHLFVLAPFSIFDNFVTIYENEAPWPSLVTILIL